MQEQTGELQRQQTILLKHIVEALKGPKPNVNGAATLQKQYEFLIISDLLDSYKEYTNKLETDNNQSNQKHLPSLKQNEEISNF